MKKLLTPNLAEILKNRVEISRNTKIFKIEEIAKEWKVPYVTIFRYTSSQYRENSRIYSKKATLLNKSKNKMLCQICGDSLKGHERCPICTQLIHEYSRHTHEIALIYKHK